MGAREVGHRAVYSADPERTMNATSRELEARSTFPYFCNLHAGMSSTDTVR